MVNFAVQVNDFFTDNEFELSIEKGKMKFAHFGCLSVSRFKTLTRVLRIAYKAFYLAK